MIGQLVSHYKIVEKLGGGGMGVVYKAEDTRLKRSVALKFLSSELTNDQEAKSRFIHEAQAASSLDHPNICNIHEIDEAGNGQLFLCMTLYDGDTLKQKIKNGSIPLAEIMSIAIQIVRGLERAHEAGIVHRDLKPANIVFTKQNEVKIVDFGLAKLTGQTDITKTGSPMGTVAYMSPEQSRGEKLGPGTDIWSFGVVLYEMFTGERPFKGDYDQAVIYSILNEQPVPIEKLHPDIPGELQILINRCLSKNPNDRYASVSEIVQILQQFVQEITPTGHVYTPVPTRVKSKRLKTYLLPASVLLVVGIIWLVWYLFFSLPDQKHIAVLPFTLIGEKGENEKYCDGLVEIINSRLTQLEQHQTSISVIPSSEIRKHKITSAGEALKKFGANLAISGSMDIRSNYIQLILNLIDTGSLRQLKSVDLKINKADMSTKMEAYVVDNILEMLELQFQPAIRADLFAGGTALPEAYDYYLQGRGYLQHYEDENNIDIAIRLFKQALSVDSTFTRAWAGLGEGYWRKYKATRNTEFVGPAMSSCTRALNQNEQYAEVYVTCGMIKNGIGEYEQAIAELKKALQIDSLYAMAYWEMGRAYQSLGDSVAALNTYKQAIRKRPAYWQGYSYLGYFYMNQGDYQKAVEAYQKIIELLPHSDLGYVRLASAYFFMDQYADAVREAETALEIERSYVALNNLAGYYYYSGKYVRSAEIFKEVFRLNQHDYRIPGNLASAFYFSGKTDSARVYYKKAAQLIQREREINPRDLLLMVKLAGYLVRLGEEKKAHQLLQDLEFRNPTSANVLFDMGDVYEQIGDREKALEWMEKAINSGFTLAKIKNNPGLKELIADQRFKDIWDKKKSLE